MIDVSLFMASSIDGVTAKHSIEDINWTCSADKQYFSNKTKEAGVVIMGSNTYKSLKKPLPGRHNVVMTRDKASCCNYNEITITALNPKQILLRLMRRGYKHAALIGGPTINSIFLQEGLISYIHLTIAPKLFGSGLSLFNGDLDIDMKLIRSQSLDPDTMLLVYKVLT